ncbi:MAG TPA: anthranilate synthase component I [Defluviitaleaceae bacterium]|nr:anthranilate synthase component I [Defluviitaleaceae bacterium]
MIYKLYSKKLDGDTQTPITIFNKYVGKEKGFLLESRDNKKGRYSFIAKRPFAEIQGRDREVTIIEGDKVIKKQGKILDIVKEYMSAFNVKPSDFIPFMGGAVGTVSYDLIRQAEKLPPANKDVIGVPDLHFMITKEMIAYDHFHQQIYLLVIEEESDEGEKRAKEKMQQMEEELLKEEEIEAIKDKVKYKKISSNMTKEEFIEKIKKAQKYMEEGDIYQIIISKRWTMETDEDAFVLYRRLRRINPSPYLYYLNFGDYQVAGSSPETLVELRKDRVYTCPIGGTRKRGKNHEEDEALKAELLNDEKDKAEHIMLIDLARNDMGKIAQIGSVQLTRYMDIHYYSHVMHMESQIEGIKNEKEDAFSILQSFLPAGTLSGVPKIRSIEIIDELEEEKRGIYGGAVGYISFDGDMDMAIAIRTMVIKDGKVYMQAGAGVVADSDPEKEDEESENKIMALLKAVE